ncbi:MAG TPA: hypothetical protein VF690_15180, partial [Hymenobacter sp.]
AQTNQALNHRLGASALSAAPAAAIAKKLTTAPAAPEVPEAHAGKAGKPEAGGAAKTNSNRYLLAS